MLYFSFHTPLILYPLHFFWYSIYNFSLLCMFFECTVRILLSHSPLVWSRIALIWLYLSALRSIPFKESSELIIPYAKNQSERRRCLESGLLRFKGPETITMWGRSKTELFLRQKRCLSSLYPNLMQDSA
jgi:hypothetical protein